MNAQTDIEYYPKLLHKTLAKFDDKQVLLNELVLSEKLTRQILVGKYFTLFSKEPASFIKFIYVGRVNTCRSGGCSINRGLSGDKGSEFFDYFILFDSTYTIRQVQIFNYQATHGQEVTAKNWLKQFVGYSGKSALTVGKDVDAISGATISVDAIAFDIEHKTGLLKQFGGLNTTYTTSNRQ